MKSASLQSIVFVAAFGALLAGCGQSKEDAALARMQNRPKPGFVRILNLTGGDASLLSRGRPVNPDVKNGESGRLNPEGVGKRTMGIQTKEGEMDVEVELTSEMGHTLVLMASSHALIQGEPRKPVEGKNLYVVFMAADGKLINSGNTVPLTAADGKVDLDPKEHAYEVASGSVSLLGKTFEVKPNFAYTILILQSGREMKPFFMLNTADDVPAAVGTSAS
ncbi:MAG: hypothetical protein AB7F50_06305 [Fimbriimonadaceae bacterium]